MLEERVAEWREYLCRRQAIQAADIEELEDHLRGQVQTLGEAGLSEEEAFLVAVKRMGDLDTLSRDFAREYSERLWKQLVLSPEEEGSSQESRREAIAAVVLAIAAAAAIKLPDLLGFDVSEVFYLRNLSLFVLPFVAGFFAWKRGLGPSQYLLLSVPFVAGALSINLMPFDTESHTLVLAALHLPIALWLAVGYAYVGGEWRNHDQRMNFVRFSGELFIYYVLIALGGGVLIGFTMLIFQAIGFDAEGFVEQWILPCGVVGAVVIAAWSVQAKQRVVENMAPVLTRLFTPLFTVLLLVYLVTMLVTASGIDVGREVLIGFDLLLVLVLGLLLYSISARDPMAPPNLFDALQLVLVLSALLVDLLALWAIAARITEFGFSPNKVAALGENVILVVNLAVSAVLYIRFMQCRTAFALLERWQTSYLPVYGIWAWIVVVLFPILFGFR